MLLHGSIPPPLGVQYDKFWQGEPPQRDVFVIGLNESVKGALLKEVCSEIAPVHAIKFHRHPKSKTFLGAATVCFSHTGSGARAARELDGKIVGGCYLRAELDDSGEGVRGRQSESATLYLAQR